MNRFKKYDDLTGRRFGKLTVESIYNISYSDRLLVQWKCRCDCGREIISNERSLKRGTRTYCGKCAAPQWATAYRKLCRRCEWSEFDEKINDWSCTHGHQPEMALRKCDDYWCSEKDKLTDEKHREGRCMLCGKPVYAHSKDIPLYCYEHKDEIKNDDKILQEAPMELLFALIAGIFDRARQDYVTNSDGQAKDAEIFLRSSWAQELSLSVFDAEAVIKELDEEIAHGFNEYREDTE